MNEWVDISKFSLILIFCTLFILTHQFIMTTALQNQSNSNQT